MVYVALLRGINVGGNTLLKMSELKPCLEKTGLENVKTYINSGNVIFTSDTTDQLELAGSIEKAIKKRFKLTVPVLVLSRPEYEKIIKQVPPGWGSDSEWKYNLLFLLPPYDMKQVISDIGELKPEIETLVAGHGVLYQTMSMKLFGRTTTGKLASKPVYKRLTIRNHRTGAKLLELMNSVV